MKMKITIFPVLLLAAASLGFALPQKPSVEGSTNTTITTQSSGVDPKLAEAVSPLGLPTGSGSPIGSLSKTCQAALLTIITDPEFLKCVPLAAVLPLVPIITDPNFIPNFLKDPKGSYQKIEQPLIQSATLLCAAPKCSKDGNDKAIKTLQDGCKDDLASKNPIAVLVFDVTVFYSPLRDTICFTDKKTKKFCWDETALTVFSLPPSPIKVTGDALVDSIAVADPFAICTDCNKDIVSTFAIFLKNNQLALQILASFGVDDKKLASLQTFTAVKCGINFLDGKIP